MHTLLLRPTSLILVVVIVCWLKGQLVYRLHGNFLHCALSLAAQCIVIGPVCDLVFAKCGREDVRAVSEPYYSQRAHSVCVSARFFN